jgi:hypothetical protein
MQVERVCHDTLPWLISFSVGLCMRGLSDSICEARRQKVLSLVTALPEASAEVCGGRHLSFKVRGKTFGYFLDDHHGHGRVALNCKTAPEPILKSLFVFSERGSAYGESNPCTSLETAYTFPRVRLAIARLL